MRHTREHKELKITAQLSAPMNILSQTDRSHHLLSLISSLIAQEAKQPLLHHRCRGRPLGSPWSSSSISDAEGDVFTCSKLFVPHYLNEILQLLTEISLLALSYFMLEMRISRTIKLFDRLQKRFVQVRISCIQKNVLVISMAAQLQTRYFYMF